MPDRREQGEGPYRAGCKVAEKVGVDVCREIKEPKPEREPKAEKERRPKKGE